VTSTSCWAGKKERTVVRTSKVNNAPTWLEFCLSIRPRGLQRVFWPPSGFCGTDGRPLQAFQPVVGPFEICLGRVTGALVPKPCGANRSGSCEESC
jgi:hypothetical protein